MLLKLLQHTLIWIAASFGIVVSMSWAHAYGFVSQRRDRWPMAVLVATAALVFSAALVQRAPSAILALVGLAIVVALVGVGLLVTGAVVSGAALVVIAGLYVATLGPSCLRWLGWTR
jgi:hypothetical protein